MTKILTTLALFALLLHSVSAQKVTYTFDYQIDMKESRIYTDSVQFPNERYIKSTWLNSKDRNYVAMLRHDKDSSQSRLIIYDFNALEMYVTYPHRPWRAIEVKPMETMGLNLAQVETPLYFRPNLGRRKKIDGYSCRKIWEKNPSYSDELWFTKDIPDAPEHSFHAIYMFALHQPKYSGVAVDYRMDDKLSRSQKHLIAAQKSIRKVVLENNVLIELEGDLKTIK
ncbi:hypothetical protein [Emticicia sp. C21]|uniref:hypothetical protein n=1 Tax=Emticicia sp. C21 TaxID=2302915 RepID=UPI000E3425A6|nr:hypothetical protein [Emticicia sp. C21]RFS16794.1 hypothetical protein D0T08_08930 [Emticicia sp. C21]